MTRDYWLTHDDEYWLWGFAPCRFGCGAWGGVAVAEDDSILSTLCPLDDRAYRLTVGDATYWLAVDDNGYGLFSELPQDIGTLRREWDGACVAQDDGILGVLVEDGGCVRLSAEEV